MEVNLHMPQVFNSMGFFRNVAEKDNLWYFSLSVTENQQNNVFCVFTSFSTFCSAPACTNNFKISKLPNQAAKCMGATPNCQTQNRKCKVVIHKKNDISCCIWPTLSFWSTLTLRCRRSCTASLFLPATA